MQNVRMSGGLGHKEFTVVYDKLTGEIVHVHLFVSHDGRPLNEEFKERIALETARLSLARRKPARPVEAVATLHVGHDALVRGNAHRVDVQTQTIIKWTPAK